MVSFMPEATTPWFDSLEVLEKKNSRKGKDNSRTIGMLSNDLWSLLAGTGTSQIGICQQCTTRRIFSTPWHETPYQNPPQPLICSFEYNIFARQITPPKFPIFTCFTRQGPIMRPLKRLLRRVHAKEKHQESTPGGCHLCPHTT